MFLLAAALVHAALVAHFLVAILRAFRAREAMALRRDRDPGDRLPAVSVVVPARDEAGTIATCLLSLLEQDYPRERLQVILVDDHSTDGTREIAEALADQHPNLVVTGAPALPAGWTGKNHACAHGAGLATGAWLCFIDADTYAEPDLVRVAVPHAEARGAELFSMNPFQLLASPGERAVLPAVFLGIAAGRDFQRIDDPATPDALANGQFMLFRREAYEALGGHGAVRAEVGEDLAFAALVKGRGMRLAWGFGDDLITVRMYSSIGQVWRGFSKNMAEIMLVEGWGQGLGVAARLLALGWLGPLVLLAAAGGIGPEAVLATRVAGASVGILAGVGLGTLRELRVPLGYLLAMPLGFAFHAALLLASLRRRQQGRREWKGRVYA